VRKSCPVLVALALACGCSGDGKPVAATSSCAKDSATLGDRRCTADNKIEQCDGAAWKTTLDCAAQGLLCSQVAHAFGATCRTRNLLGEVCAGLGQGNCDAALICQANVCQRPCDPSASPAGCGTGEACLPLAAGGYCVRQVTTGGTCLFDLGCATNTDSCVPYLRQKAEDGGQLVGVCGPSCRTDELYTQGSCSAGEQCLFNPGDYVDPQVTASGANVPCDLTSATPSSTCDTASGYFCMKVRTVKNGYLDLCANAHPICGQKLPLFGRGTDLPDPVTAAENCAVPELGGNRAFCGLGMGATAVPRCLSLYNDPVAPQGVCVASCNDYASGSAMPDLSCGAGFECYLPLSDAETLYVNIQRKADNSMVTCTSAAVCKAGYSCVGGLVTDVKICAQPHKLCRVKL